MEDPFLIIGVQIAIGAALSALVAFYVVVGVLGLFWKTIELLIQLALHTRRVLYSQLAHVSPDVLNASIKQQTSLPRKALPK